MTRATPTILGSGILCVALASAATIAQTPAAPTAARPATTAAAPARTAQAPKPVATTAAPRPAAAHAVAGADQNAIIKRYCIGCHNEKRKDSSGGLALETFDVAKAADHAAVAEQDDPQAAGRHDAAARRVASRRRRIRVADLGARNDDRCRAAAQAEPRPPHVPAPQSRRIQARDPRAASISTSTPASGCRSTR